MKNKKTPTTKTTRTTNRNWSIRQTCPNHSNNIDVIQSWPEPEPKKVACNITIPVTHVSINWVYNVKICLSQKNVVYNVKIYVSQKNGVYNVNIYVSQKNGGYNVKICVNKKNRRLQCQNLRKQKKWGLQRQNLRNKRKIGVYNVTDNVNQNRTRQPKHPGPIIGKGVWTNKSHICYSYIIPLLSPSKSTKFQKDFVGHPPLSALPATGGFSDPMPRWNHSILCYHSAPYTLW